MPRNNTLTNTNIHTALLASMRPRRNAAEQRSSPENPLHGGEVASMRPRRNAAEQHDRTAKPTRSYESFNEAAA